VDCVKNEILSGLEDMSKIIGHSYQVYFCIGIVRFAVSGDGERIEIVK